jgi:hypothetical protein
MFASAIAASIPATSLSGLDHVARDLWRAYSAGAIDDPDAEALASAIEVRRRVLLGKGHEEAAGPPKPFHGRPTRFPPRKVQVSPDRRRSSERRRTLAASGFLPPQIACRFTQGEQAVLSIVAAEALQHGACDRSLAELAARAGVCRTLARSAIRLAARLGLVSIELRPRRGRKSLTNLVRVTDPAWRAWLTRGERIGCRNPHPTGIGFRNKGREGALKRPEQANRGAPEYNLSIDGIGGGRLRNLREKHGRGSRLMPRS